MSSYVDIEDALQVINRYGFHLPDIGLLTSALARPEDQSHGCGSIIRSCP